MEQRRARLYVDIAKQTPAGIGRRRQSGLVPDVVVDRVTCDGRPQMLARSAPARGDRLCAEMRCWSAGLWDNRSKEANQLTCSAADNGSMAGLAAGKLHLGRGLERGSGVPRLIGSGKAHCDPSAREGRVEIGRRTEGSSRMRCQMAGR